MHTNHTFELNTKIFYFLFFILLITGVVSRFDYNLLPANPILELLFIVFSLSLFSFSMSREAFVYFLASFLYCLFSLYYAVLINNAHLLDVIQAYKAFIYIPFLAVAINKMNFEFDYFLRFYRVCLVFFFVKYSYSKIFDFAERIGDRPGIFTENNFELMLLILPLYVLAKFKTQRLHLYLLSVFLIIVISGSRSALLAFFVCFAFTFFEKIDRKFFIFAFFSPLLILIGAEVFQSRAVDGQGIEDIDRFKLFLFFLEETSNWNLFNYILGAERITRLSDATCLSLPYYDELYSFSGDNSCYSVIFHSYIMRVVFDHGLIGFAFILSFYYRALLLSGYNLKLRIGFIISIVMSSLSVSSFNSVYVALPLLFAVASYSRNKEFGK